MQRRGRCAQAVVAGRPRRRGHEIVALKRPRDSWHLAPKAPKRPPVTRDGSGDDRPPAIERRIRTMTIQQAPQAGAAEHDRPRRAPQMAAQAPTTPRPKAPGYAPAFGGASGAAWVFRDLASI